MTPGSWRNGIGSACGGLANSRNIEKVVFAWKGKIPAGLPRERRWVDPGSGLYNEVVLKVLVVHPKELGFVDKTVREESIRSMCGISDGGSATGAAEGEGDGTASAPDQELIKHVKKNAVFIDRRPAKRSSGSRTTTLQPS